MKAIRLTVFAVSMLGLGACARQAQVNTPAETPAPRGNLNTTAIRLCDTPVEVPSEAVIQKFFEKVVRNIEGKPTACLSVDNSSTTKVDASFRFEYEDDFGIRYYNAAKEDVFAYSLDLDANTLDVIFIDEVGFVQIKGPIGADDMISATIKYYNFPSQEEWINEQLAAAKEACQRAADRARRGQNPVPGEPTVANCLGYNQPAPNWWDMPANQLGQDAMMLEQAHEMLASDQAKTLGTVKFDLADVLQQ